MTSVVRQTFTANTLWWVEFQHGIQHPTQAFLPAHNRALYHPLTWPDLVGLRVTTTHTDLTHVLVVDRYTGTLPVVALDEWMARAIVEDWNRQVRAQAIDPGDVDAVMSWARDTTYRSPRAELITTVDWPRTLPRTPYHDVN